MMLVAMILFASTAYIHDVASLEESIEIPRAYRTITHLHTCFSHDAKFGSEPSLQLGNLKQLGYQVVLVSEHDYSTIGAAQTDFTIPPLNNGGFEVGSPYPSQWKLVNSPRESATYFNTTDSSQSMQGNRSFRLGLTGQEDDFDLLSWACWEKGKHFLHDRPTAYNLWLRFSVFFSESTASDSAMYISISLGRRDDPKFPEVSNKLSFYFSKGAWKDESVPDLCNGTQQLSVWLDSPSPGEWQTYTLNITDYAFRLRPTLGDIPAKYLMLKQVTLNLASRRGASIEIWMDDFQVFSRWTSAEMYDWWRRDIESYSDLDFLVIAGLETSVTPDIGAYGLEVWHNFSVYESVEERVKNIKVVGALSSLVNPRASNLTAVSQEAGWGAELLEIFNTVHDQEPSSQVLRLWDDFLSQGSAIFGVAGFDSHGLIGVPGTQQPTVASKPIYENLVIAKFLNREEILSALRHGRMYIVRSDYPIRMSFTAGSGGPQQGGGVVYISPNTGVVINVCLESVPLGSELLVIQNGSTISRIDLKEEKFNQEIRLPLTDKSSYLRLEVQHGGERVALSNPLFFRQAALPQDVWVALDPTSSSSKVTSVQGENDQVEVQLYGTTGSASWVSIHIPSYPRKVLLENLDYSGRPSPNKDALSVQEHGWTYDERTGMLTAKITHHGLGTIHITYGDPAEEKTASRGAPFPEMPKYFERPQTTFLYALLSFTIVFAIALAIHASTKSTRS